MSRTKSRGGALLIKRKSEKNCTASSAPKTTESALATGVQDPTSMTLLPSEPRPLATWLAADGTVVGTAHLRCNPPKPCQDSALADVEGRPLLVVADGAGSAAVSHLGALAVVGSIRRLCRTLEGDLAAALDVDISLQGKAESIARRIVLHAKGVLDDLGEAHQRPAEDFRCTLLVWLSGQQRAMWLKVGDGALVAAVDGECRCIGPAGKGEFANQTCFVGRQLAESQWAWGEIDAAQLSGMAAMSDGAAERLVSTDSSRVSPAISKLLRGVATAQVGRREIFGLLAEAEFWKGTSGDDKSLAIVAREMTC
jgi:hypothetical protein